MMQAASTRPFLLREVGELNQAAARSATSSIV